MTPIFIDGVPFWIPDSSDSGSSPNGPIDPKELLVLCAIIIGIPLFVLLFVIGLLYVVG